MNELMGSRALVTGASRGIGRAIALRLGRAGAQLALVADNQAELGETCREFAQAGISCHGLERDLADVEAAIETPHAAAHLLGGLDILVNNAGIAPRIPAFDVAPADWDRIFSINARAAFFCSREAGRLMGEAGGGCIINVSSVQQFVASHGLQAVYAASKGALGMLTRALALEWSGMKVRVNAVAPGSIDTAINSAFFATPANLERNRAQIPLGHVGSVEDVAGAVAFLCSTDAKYITGSTLVVDGGWTIH
jgi:2-deoxy-D-gluconate 3-dehydrogenase